MENKSASNSNGFKCKLFALVFLLASATFIFAQSVNPKLYPFSPERSLMVWQNGSNSEEFLAQFVLKNGVPEGTHFAIYGNELIAPNSGGDFMVTRSRNYSGGEVLPSSTDINAKIFHSAGDTTNPFAVQHIEWPMCGTGYLGFEEQLTGYGLNFLYVNQDNGRLESKLYNPSGEMILEFPNDRGNAVGITVDVLPDHSYTIVWFNARFDDWNTLPYGIYATIVEQNEIKADSVLIKAYSDSPDYGFGYPWGKTPQLRLKALNDSLYQLFVFEPDSFNLYSLILDREAILIQSDKYMVPRLIYPSGDNIPNILAFNISNIAEGTRSLFLSTNRFVDNQLRRANYLYYFTDEGSLKDEPYIDTLLAFPSDYFLFKTGDEKFINPSQRGEYIYGDTYQNFALIDSSVIGHITSLNTAGVIIPDQFNLHQNFPNPFNSQTNIRFSIARSGRVNLTIYNIAGQKIRTVIDKPMAAGTYNINVELNEISSGLYYYQLKNHEGSKVRKMLLIK